MMIRSSDGDKGTRHYQEGDVINVEGALLVRE